MGRWTGALLCVLIAVAFVVSTQRAVVWSKADLRYDVAVQLGACYFGWRPSGWNRAADKYAGVPGWKLAKYGGATPLIWWVEVGALPKWRWVSVPLWMPFVALALPTGILWYGDRRRVLPGHCRACGYDLTGNVSGRCQECGAACPAGTATPDRPVDTSRA